MNPESPQSPRDELEARLTALLLGELSADEAVALRETIARDPDLRRLHDRLKLALELVREAGAAPELEQQARPEPLTLAAERRGRLLALFQQSAPGKVIQPVAFWTRQRREWLQLAAMLVALMLVTGMLTFSFKRNKHAYLADSLEGEALPASTRFMLMLGLPVGGEAYRDGSTQVSAENLEDTVVNEHGSQLIEAIRQATNAFGPGRLVINGVLQAPTDRNRQGDKSQFVGDPQWVGALDSSIQLAAPSPSDPASETQAARESNPFVGRYAYTVVPDGSLQLSSPAGRPAVQDGERGEVVQRRIAAIALPQPLDALGDIPDVSFEAKGAVVAGKDISGVAQLGQEFRWGRTGGGGMGSAAVVKDPAAAAPATEFVTAQQEMFRGGGMGGGGGGFGGAPGGGGAVQAGQAGAKAVAGAEFDGRTAGGDAVRDLAEKSQSRAEPALAASGNALPLPAGEGRGEGERGVKFHMDLNRNGDFQSTAGLAVQDARRKDNTSWSYAASDPAPADTTPLAPFAEARQRNLEDKLERATTLDRESGARADTALGAKVDSLAARPAPARAAKPASPAGPAAAGEKLTTWRRALEEFKPASPAAPAAPGNKLAEVTDLGMIVPEATPAPPVSLVTGSLKLEAGSQPTSPPALGRAYKAPAPNASQSGNWTIRTDDYAVQTTPLPGPPPVSRSDAVAPGTFMPSVQSVSGLASLDKASGVERAEEAKITVLRTNGSVGGATANFYALDGTAVANNPVPAQRPAADPSGHGTFVAGVQAGSTITAPITDFDSDGTRFNDKVRAGDGAVKAGVDGFDAPVNRFKEAQAQGRGRMPVREGSAGAIQFGSGKYEAGKEAKLADSLDALAVAPKLLTFADGDSTAAGRVDVERFARGVTPEALKRTMPVAEPESRRLSRIELPGLAEADKEAKAATTARGNLGDVQELAKLTAEPRQLMAERESLEAGAMEKKLKQVEQLVEERTRSEEERREKDVKQQANQTSENLGDTAKSLDNVTSLQRAADYYERTLRNPAASSPPTPAKPLPPLTNLQQLVEYRVIRAIPTAPEGKKFVFNPAEGKVALVDVAASEVAQKEIEPPAPPKVAPPNAPVPQPEVSATENAFSTFSLNVSDVSFKLAQASLEKGVMPDVTTVRSEEFINAFNYHDPEPTGNAPIAFAWERARYPFAHDRDLLRFSVKTAASGRQANRPLNLVLLLDNSGSMERADRVLIRQECLRVLAGQLQPQDRISVVAFARTPRLWVDGLAGGPTDELMRRVGGLAPEGGTNLEEAMNVAYQTALKHFLPNGVNRVVLLTDGAANLGDVEPESLKKQVEARRKQGVALDCFGIGWDGYNDDLLEALSRNGDGRYGFVNTPLAAATEFAGQLAGALKVAASDVKVQVEWNPRRVTTWRQIGYAKHQLKKEQFRDNTVDAAEIAAAEAGNALYTVQINPRGEGPIGTVRVRFKVPGTSDYREHEWAVPYEGVAKPLEQAGATIRLAATASAFSEWLVTSPFAAEVKPDQLLAYLAGVPEQYPADPRPKQLEWMIRQAKSVAGR